MISDQLVVVDELESLLQGHADQRSQHLGFVGTGGTHVGQLLAFQAVDGQVVGAEWIPITWPSYTSVA